MHLVSVEFDFKHLISKWLMVHADITLKGKTNKQTKIKSQPAIFVMDFEVHSKIG